MSGIHAEKGNVATSPSDVNASEANKTTITPVDKRDILSSRPSAVTSPLKNSPTSINTVTPPAKLIKSNSENNDNTRTITKPLINGTSKKAKNKKRQSVTASFRSQLRKELLQLKKQRLKQKQKIAHDKSKNNTNGKSDDHSNNKNRQRKGDSNSTTKTTAEERRKRKQLLLEEKLKRGLEKQNALSRDRLEKKKIVAEERRKKAEAREQLKRLKEEKKRIEAQEVLKRLDQVREQQQLVALHPPHRCDGQQEGNNRHALSGQHGMNGPGGSAIHNDIPAAVASANFANFNGHLRTEPSHNNSAIAPTSTNEHLIEKGINPAAAGKTPETSFAPKSPPQKSLLPLHSSSHVSNTNKIENSARQHENSESFTASNPVSTPLHTNTNWHNNIVPWCYPYPAPMQNIQMQPYYQPYYQQQYYQQQYWNQIPTVGWSNYYYNNSNYNPNNTLLHSHYQLPISSSSYSPAPWHSSSTSPSLLQNNSTTTLLSTRTSLKSTTSEQKKKQQQQRSNTLLRMMLNADPLAPPSPFAKTHTLLTHSITIYKQKSVVSSSSSSEGGGGGSFGVDVRYDSRGTLVDVEDEEEEMEKKKETEMVTEKEAEMVTRKETVLYGNEENKSESVVTTVVDHAS